MPNLSQQPADLSGVAAKPAASDAYLYVSVNGNDSNDGLSWGSAKRNPANARAALVSAGASKGAIELGPGSFTFTASQDFSMDNVKVKGQGIDVTTIVDQRASGANHSVTWSGNDGELEDLTIDASAAPTPSSSTYALYVTGLRFRRRRVKVIAQAAPGGGTYFNGAHGSRDFNGRDPVRVNATDVRIFHPKIDNGVRLAVFMSGSDRGRVWGGTYRNDGTLTSNANNPGLQVDSCAEFEAIGVKIDGATGHGFQITGCTEPVLRGCSAYRSGRYRADADGTISGFQIDNCTNPQLFDPVSVDHPGYGIFCGGASGTGTGGDIYNAYVHTCGDPGFSSRAATGVKWHGGHVKNATFGFRFGEGPGDAPATDCVIDGTIFEDCGWAVGGIRGSSNNKVRYHAINCAWDSTTTNWPSCHVIVEDDSTKGSLGNEIVCLSNVANVNQGTLKWVRYLARFDSPTGYTGTKSKGNVVRAAKNLTGFARGAALTTATPAGTSGVNKLGDATNTEKDVDSLSDGEQIYDFVSGITGGAADATAFLAGMTGSWKQTQNTSTNGTIQVALPTAFKTGGVSALDAMPADAFITIAVLIDATSNHVASISLRFANASGSDTNEMASGTMTVVEAAGQWWRLRIPMASFQAVGTGTWANANYVRINLAASAGGQAIVNWADLRVVRAG